jgi:exonuclease III
MTEKIRVTSWNVRGFSAPTRARIVKTWLSTQSPRVDVLCLQELQATTSMIDLQLQSFWPSGFKKLDSLPNGRVGCPLLVAPHLKVLDSGCRGDGTMVWALIDSPQGSFYVASIYAPRVRSLRMELWNWITEQEFTGNWIWSGDFNMCKIPDDSNCHSPILHGSEARKWTALIDDQDLVDLYFVAAYRTGPHFSRQVVRGGAPQQSRLDRIYASNRAEWFDYTELLDHDASQALSDHIPVSAVINLKVNHDERLAKLSYYKIDSSLLSNEAVLEKAKVA